MNCTALPVREPQGVSWTIVPYSSLETTDEASQHGTSERPRGERWRKKAFSATLRRAGQTRQGTHAAGHAIALHTCVCAVLHASRAGRPCTMTSGRANGTDLVQDESTESWSRSISIHNAVGPCRMTEIPMGLTYPMLKRPIHWSRFFARWFLPPRLHPLPSPHALSASLNIEGRKCVMTLPAADAGTDEGRRGQEEGNKNTLV